MSEYDEENNLDGRSKNKPKLRMAKIPAEGPGEQESVRRVCEIMMHDNRVRNLCLIIPEVCFVKKCWPRRYCGGSPVYYGGMTVLRDTQKLLQSLVFCEIWLDVYY